MAIPTDLILPPPNCPAPTRLDSPPTTSPNGDVERLKQAVQQDLTATTQCYLLMRNSLTRKFMSDPIKIRDVEKYLSNFDQAFQGSIFSSLEKQLDEERSRLTSFRLSDILTIDSLTALRDLKMGIIEDNENGRFDRFVLTLIDALIRFLKTCSDETIGNKAAFEHVEREILNKLAQEREKFQSLAKEGERGPPYYQSAGIIQSLNKLVEFCTTVELCMENPVKRGIEPSPTWPDWRPNEKAWESMWESDFGQYVTITYLIEICKKEYQNYKKDPKNPLNKCAYTVLLSWITELLLTSYPELVAETHVIIGEEIADPEASNIDALKELQIITTSCYQEYYPLQWQKYILSLLSSSVDQAAENRLLQPYETTPNFESWLREANKDRLIKSTLTLEAVAPYHKNHPQAAALLQPLVNDTIDAIYFSRLWKTYITQLTQSYPSKPKTKEFSTIEQELIIAAQQPNTPKAIMDYFHEVLKEAYFKTVDFRHISNIWQRKPVVPGPLKKLVEESYNILWGFRTTQVIQTPSTFNTPHGRASNMMMLDFLASKGSKLFPSPINSEDSIRKKLSLMSTSGLVTWYFGQLQKKQNASEINAAVQEIDSRPSLSSTDVQTADLSIAAMKTLHDAIAQSSLNRKQVLLGALNKSIENKLPRASLADLNCFLAAMENTPSNGWHPFAVAAHAKLLVSECRLYFTNLPENPPFAALVATKINNRFTHFSPQENDISSLLDPLTAPELQALHAGISSAAALDVAPKTYFLKALEQRLLKKIEAMDHLQARQFIASLKANPEDPHDSSGTLYALAEAHVEKCLRKKSTEDLIKTYLKSRIAILQTPALADVTDIALIEKILLTKKNFFPAMTTILSHKKMSNAFQLDDLISLEKALDSLLEDSSPLNKLKVLVRELIALGIWSLPKSALADICLNTASPFIRQLAQQRYHSSFNPPDQKTDPLSLALSKDPSAHERLHELPMQSLKEARQSLIHLRDFSSCQISSIQDRLKALKILDLTLQNPSRSTQPLDHLWKSFITHFASEKKTNELAALRKGIESKNSEDFRSFIHKITDDHPFMQSFSLKDVMRMESNLTIDGAFSQQLHKILRTMIIIKLWELPKETLKELQSKPLSPFAKKEIDRHLQTLAQSAIFQSKLMDPLLGNIASSLAAIPQDDLPTMKDYIKAKKLSDFGKKLFKTTTVSDAPFEERLWNAIEPLSIPELQSLEQTISHAGIKQIITHYLQARQLADSPSPTQTTHYFPIALALALRPNEPHLIKSLMQRRPSRENKLKHIEQQITFLESLPNKTPFMKTLIQAYRFALEPPSIPTSLQPATLPPPPAPKPKTISEPPLKKLVPLYFLELHANGPKAQEYLLEMAKNTQDINPRKLAVDCFAEFKHLSLSDFERLFSLIAQIADAPLKGRAAPYLMELLWEKLASLSEEEINKHVENKKSVATPILQTYRAVLLAKPAAPQKVIDAEQDPLTLALAIARQQPRPRKVLVNALEALLQNKPLDEKNRLLYQKHIANLASSRTGLIKHRSDAYQLLCQKSAEIKNPHSETL